MSISEELVNDYLRLIGDHQIPKGKSGNKALWTIKDPQVKFEEAQQNLLHQSIIKVKQILKNYQ